MLSNDILGQVERMMVICNACRYCEGFCAVFPAMERRRVFSTRDLVFLANLCHNCRDCYYSCQYAPPHEFDVNVPKTFQRVQVETYKQFVWPRFFSSIYSRNGSAVALITTAITTIVLLLVIFMHASEMFASRVGEGAFYAVIPYNLMVLPSIVIVLWCLLALLIGIIRFWHKIGEKSISLLCRSLVSATADALSLRYLKGGGHGCAFPDERISHLRRWLHHLVFYGFMLCFAATAVAATYEHVLLRTAPYPFWSIPVMLGTIGGVALLIGAGGLFWFKWQSDQSPSNRCFRGMDLVFSALLFLVSLTGLLLLALRETQAMGLMLAVHLGFVWGLFLTLPYGKFVHAIFRYAALIQNEIEAYYEKKQHE